jgi:hypothetical protein
MEDDKSASFEATKELFGVVNKEEVAKDIARALVRGAYSQREVERQEPFQASRDGDMWEITGSGVPTADTPNSDGTITLTSASLGPVRISISAKTGEIMNFITKRLLFSAWPGCDAGEI